MEACLKTKTKFFDVDKFILIYKTTGEGNLIQLIKHYHRFELRWYRSLLRKASIEREVFASEFYITLYNCFQQFEFSPEQKEAVLNALEETKFFNYYFCGAMRRKCLDLIRSFYSKKNTIERYSVPFSLVEHDREINISPDESEIVEMIKERIKSRKEQEILLGTLRGDSVKEVCGQLGITYYNYTCLLQKLQERKDVIELLV